METAYEKFNIVNVYCQPLQPIAPILEKLELIIKKQKQRNEKIIIVMDSNAKSSLWHANKTDGRGALLGELIFFSFPFSRWKSS